MNQSENLHPTPPRHVNLVTFVVLYSVGFAWWIILRPGDHHTFVAVDNLAQALGPALVLCWTVASGWRRRYLFAPFAANRALLVPSILLALGVMSNATGQAVYTVEHLILHTDAYPSPAEWLFLAAYPCLVGALLLLLPHTSSLVRRARLTTETLLISLAAVIFSWYFVLGPLVLVPDPNVLGWLVGLAFPLGDLLLLTVLTIVWTSSRRATFLPPLLYLTGAALIVVIADSTYDYQIVHGGYGPGGVVDVAWPVGYMLIGLGIVKLWRPNIIRDLRASAAPEREEIDLEADRNLPQLVRSLLPLALALAVDLLTVVASIVNESPQYDVSIDKGVYVGAAVYTIVLVVHQTLVVLENRQLHARLRLSQRELRNRNAELEAIASQDPLTGLPNRRSIGQALDRQIEWSRRYHSPFALLVLDIDHFKTFNDVYGHLVGDAVLRAVAAVLPTVLRRVDLVGRWGGEEFVAILPETDAAAARIVAERLRLIVAECSSGIHAVGQITCSIGGAVCPDDAREMDALLGLADQAMYAAKQAGRNQVWMSEQLKVAACTPDSPTSFAV